MILFSLLFILLAIWSLPVSFIKFLLFLLIAGAVWLPRKREQRYIIPPMTLITLVMLECLFYAVDYRPFDEVLVQDKIPLPYIMFGYESGLRETGESEVILLGGSTVYGYGVPDDETIDAHLERLIGQSVTNWGQVSFNSRQELLLFLQELDSRPQAVITYDGINDLLLPWSYDPRPGYPYNFYATEAGDRLLRGDGSLFDLLGLLAQKTRTGQALFQQEIYHQFARVEVNRDEEWQTAIVDAYRANLQRFCDLSRVYGYEYYAFLQPHLVTKSPLVGDEQQIRVNEDYRGYSLNIYEQARQMFEDLQVENPDCHFVDISLIFEGVDTELFSDQWHVNGEGNRIIAEAVFRNW